MFEVIRTKNDNKTIIENLGIMTEGELIAFASNYIGDDTSKYGIIFRNKRELINDIKWIKRGNDESWFEYEESNLQVKYMKGETNEKV